MKYPDPTAVAAAEYTPNDIGGTFLNPFLEAMPDMLGKEEFFRLLKSFPAMPYEIDKMTAEKRRQYLPLLHSMFYPMDYMYSIYDLLYRAMAVTYTARSTIDSVRQINAIHPDFRTGQTESHPYAVQAESFSILGVPGIGKTSTIKRCLSLMPQVIMHTQYKGKPFYNKQITYLFVECPSDCSVKTLGFNIAAAIDQAIGSDYFTRISTIKSISASAIATQIKIICLNHHVGLMVIDEIQNAVVTARKNKQIRPLIKFLVELTNDACAGTCFVGTPMAEELFISQEHLKRRTRGLRLLPMRPDRVYRDFISTLWAYQFTAHKTELTDRIMNRIYDFSGGIPAYVMKIFQEAQAQAIISGWEQMDESTIQKAVTFLSIQVPKSYLKGTYLSDFSNDTGYIQVPEDAVELKEPQTEDSQGIPISGEGDGGFTIEKSADEGSDMPENVPRLFAKPRGRKRTLRDQTDLIQFLKQAKSAEAMVSALDKFDMLEMCKIG